MWSNSVCLCESKSFHQGSDMWAASWRRAKNYLGRDGRQGKGVGIRGPAWCQRQCLSKYEKLSMARAQSCKDAAIKSCRGPQGSCSWGVWLTVRQFRNGRGAGLRAIWWAALYIPPRGNRGLRRGVDRNVPFPPPHPVLGKLKRLGWVGKSD